MDLQWTDAQWISFFEKFGPAISLYHRLYELYTILRSEKVWIFTHNDVNSSTSKWNFSGVVLGDNTDTDAKLYIEIASLYGGTTVSVYKDSGKHYNDMVCQGTGSGILPYTITLAEKNDSGLTGTVTLFAVTPSSDIYLTLTQGMLAQINNLDVEDDFDARIKADLATVMAPIAGDLLTAIERIRTIVSTYLLSRFTSEKMETAENGVYFPDDSQATGGTVTIEDDGVFKYLEDNMEDNTPNLQALKANGIAYALPVEDANNTGEAEFAAVPGRQNLRKGKITFECTDATHGSETFEVSLMSERGVRLEANNDLVVDSTYRDSVLGLNDFIIRHKVTEVGESLNKFSTWVITGINDENSDSGVIYWEHSTATGFKLRGFSDAARANAVIETTTTVTGAGTYTFVALNDSGLAGSVVASGAISADPYQFSTSQTFFAVGDKIYMTTFNNFEGYISTFFARNLRYEFPTLPSLYTIPDEIGNRGFGPGFGELWKAIFLSWV